MQNIFLIPLIDLVIMLLSFYKTILLITVIVSWLVSLNVLNTYNRGVFVFVNALNKLTEPVLYQVRKVVPVVGGLDFSPIVVFLGLIFLTNVLEQLKVHLL